MWNGWGQILKSTFIFASDYFDTDECAVKLIKKGKAYVCDLSAEEIREYRGTLKEPGKKAHTVTARRGKPSAVRRDAVKENIKMGKRFFVPRLIWHLQY